MYADKDVARESMRQYQKKWSADNPDKIAVNQKRYRETHKDESRDRKKAWRGAFSPERIEEARQKKREYMRRKRADPAANEIIKARSRDYWNRNKVQLVEVERARRLKRKFGLTVEQYDAMLASQAGGCALCGGTDPCGRRLAVDHDHNTGRVRGLLCFACNRTLGRIEGKFKSFMHLFGYLQRG